MPAGHGATQPVTRKASSPSAISNEDCPLGQSPGRGDGGACGGCRGVLKVVAKAVTGVQKKPSERQGGRLQAGLGAALPPLKHTPGAGSQGGGIKSPSANNPSELSTVPTRSEHQAKEPFNTAGAENALLEPGPSFFFCACLPCWIPTFMFADLC